MGFRAPSEWSAEFARNEFLFSVLYYRKFGGLKVVFSEALKPQYQALLQWEVDRLNNGLDSISLILKKEAHVKSLKEYLTKNRVVACDTDSWHQQFLPNVPTLKKKVSFHSS